jgi:hypothetical protein
MNDIKSVVAVVLALSVASERLVEIIKGWIPKLNIKNEDPVKEGHRTATLQVMAVLASILTALVCYPGLQKVMPENWNTIPAVIALGLLASGGSGLWNSILTWVLRLKDVEAAAAKKEKVELALREYEYAVALKKVQPIDTGKPELPRKTG